MYCTVGVLVWCLEGIETRSGLFHQVEFALERSLEIAPVAILAHRDDLLRAAVDERSPRGVRVLPQVVRTQRKARRVGEREQHVEHEARERLVIGQIGRVRARATWVVEPRDHIIVFEVRVVHRHHRGLAVCTWSLQQ